MLVILYFLSAFSAVTQKSTAERPFTPHQLNACAIVTNADVEESIGLRVSNGHEETQAKGSTCDYSTRTGLVSITIQKLTERPDWNVEIAALKKEIPEGMVRAAPEFAEAFYLDIPEAGTQLHIVKDGSQHLMISILGFGDAPKVSGVAAQIVRKAITRF